MADKSRPVLDPETGKPTGRFEKKVFNAGVEGGAAVYVESDTDLVAKLGPGKFAYAEGGGAAEAEIASLKAKLAALESRAASDASTGGLRTPGDPTPENLVHNPATFPGGQVSTGFQGGAPKEAREAVKGAAGPSDAELEAMTVAQLKAHAEDVEIDVKGAHTKADYLKAIRAAR
jgi:hypothetical protein